MPQNLKNPTPIAVPCATPPAAQENPEGQPADVGAIRKEIQTFLKQFGAGGTGIKSARCGVYAFYDYDGEPIYIGQTYEGIGARISRHLTNHRTDAVAMNVLDPFEVAEIRVWLIEPYARLSKAQIKESLSEIKAALESAEYTLYLKVIQESSFKAVLNEKPPAETAIIELPKPFIGRIIPADIFPHRKHPDIRIARRASTIAALARVISERKVNKGLRKTLLTQAKRLEKLAADRLAELHAETDDGDPETDSEN